MEPIKKISINDTEYQIVDETALHDDDMPTTLPNPYALTFTGAATSIYDGSEATTIDIPTVAGVDAHNADSSAHADIREEISQLSSEIEDLKNGENTSNEVPDYWLPVLEEGAEAINTALCEAGSNKSAFLFYSDAHWTSGSQKSPLLLKWLYKNTGINKTYFGGDVVDNEAANYDTMKYLWTWRNLLREVPNHHSVVGNHDDGNATNNLFSEKYVYGYLFGPEEGNDIVRGGDTYYYYDEKSERTRYIFLDTAYKCMTAAQQEFLKQTLISTPDMWHIVVIAHIWYGPDYDNYNVRPIPIVGLSADATIVTNILDAYNSRIGDYESCGGWVEFCIGGHVHRDYDNTTATGIPIILVETDSSHTRGTYSYEEGSTSEASVNGIIADYDKHKIYVVRIGRGESREVSITTHVLSYTNCLPLALDVRNPSTTLVGDGTAGYLADSRYSSSGGGYVAADGWDITGLIPVKVGDIVRIENIMARGYTEIPSNHDFGNISFYLSDFSWYNGVSFLNLEAGHSIQMVLDESNNIVQFTIPNWNSDIAYFSITCQDINQNSIITVNEEIPETDPDDPGTDEPDPEEPGTGDDETYTNVLPLALEANGTSVYNGIGYKADTRWSESGQSESTSTGDYLTGYIPVSNGDIIYCKNIDLTYSDDGSGGKVLWSNALGSTSGSANGAILTEYKSATWHADGTIASFVVVDYSYIRIMCKGITDASIITINEEIPESDPGQDTPTYTNVIKTSVGTDGEIFNSGKGWADNSRIGSGGIYLGNGTYYVTGHIEIDRTADVTVYLENVTFGANSAVAFFDSSFTRIAIDGTSNWLTLDSLKNYFNAVVDDSGNLTQFTIPTSKMTNTTLVYMAIQADYIGDDSIITINEPIE